MALFEKGSPHIQNLKAGETVYICQCGNTGNPPYCDGSHQGSEFTPLAHTANQDGDVYICGCGKSGNKPWCDGSHSQ